MTLIRQNFIKRTSKVTRTFSFRPKSGKSDSGTLGAQGQFSFRPLGFRSPSHQAGSRLRTTLVTRSVELVRCPSLPVTRTPRGQVLHHSFGASDRIGKSFNWASHETRGPRLEEL
ncbi:uncharacterized protein CIMG_12794 [Coccidioides immitis RS]|uniref:Uncharacterized protein n=1 Tax=Coccidioides immitis (strain RS) TaxID=246410 RepID=A0A0D8JSU6_COCIM|nr:uncharacterized protein CIMG_12794 [Coccidioides immitis RS]KJF60184.1 hypothetical protein CIMG_12794 [Coccidioides immitis RS]